MKPITAWTRVTKYDPEPLEVQIVKFVTVTRGYQHDRRTEVEAVAIFPDGDIASIELERITTIKPEPWVDPDLLRFLQPGRIPTAQTF